MEGNRRLHARYAILPSRAGALVKPNRRGVIGERRSHGESHRRPRVSKNEAIVADKQVCKRPTGVTGQPERIAPANSAGVLRQCGHRPNETKLSYGYRSRGFASNFYFLISLF